MASAHVVGRRDAVAKQCRVRLQSVPADVQPLLNSSCMACHSNTALSPLNLAATDFDLRDAATFRVWERVFDRVARGEMPPAPLPPPDPAVAKPALKALEQALTAANLSARGPQRTPLRRLTRLEYQYTIGDLLAIDPAQAQGLVQTLPAEADSGGFDTVAASQGISALHVRSYLAAADAALDLALAIGPPAETKRFAVNYAESPYLGYMHEGEFLGAGVTKSWMMRWRLFSTSRLPTCSIRPPRAMPFRWLAAIE